MYVVSVKSLGLLAVLAVAAILAVKSFEGDFRSSPQEPPSGGPLLSGPSPMVYPNVQTTESSSQDFPVVVAPRETPEWNMGNGRISRLSAMLAKADDFRKFALEARTHPSDGGYFFAMKAVDFCGRDVSAVRQDGLKAISEIIAKNSTITVKQSAAVNRYSEKCGSFAPGEAEELYREISEQSADGADPLVRLKTAFAKADGGSDQQRAAAQHVLQRGDLDLISDMDLLTRLSTARDGSIVFEGQVYDGDRKPIALLGLMLATCTDANFCALDEEIMVACSTKGACFDSREEYLQAEYLTPNDTTSLHSAVELAGHARQALLRGNTRAFGKS